MPIKSYDLTGGSGEKGLEERSSLPVLTMKYSCKDPIQGFMSALIKLYFQGSCAGAFSYVAVLGTSCLGQLLMASTCAS